MSKPVVNYSKDLVWFDTMPGEQMAVRLHSNQVGGALSIVEARVPSLMGPPKHIHNEREETFEILDGTFRFQVGDEEFDATPGTSVLVPRGVPHAWANVGPNMGRILFIFTPGGIDGFFPEIGRHSLEEIVKIASENDTVIIGPPMVVK
ncbi:cupin domain-containing protein [Paenibacillus qinlingensis]|uniref:Quercetin dioxygenase-like cupin family protein n=1 Tax=Paenibacillus qinlingensis TaxID=1837343 RepID=A0ABU1NU48_9BACL|nr:cupin domain-containing protein [Paenibacillus qinlingensis]MDR6550357.1 quercetin dioxygenase-like cupin family protein [Paenibacillus qinlingensis]